MFWNSHRTQIPPTVLLFSVGFLITLTINSQVQVLITLRPYLNVTVLEKVMVGDMYNTLTV